MRLKLISCEIFAREVEAVRARSRNNIDVELLAKVPHQLSDHETMVYFQTLIDRAAAQYQAVLLVAGSCRQSLTGLRARAVPLVLPRAKDCISLLMSGADTPKAAAPEQFLKMMDLTGIHEERRRATALSPRAGRSGPARKTFIAAHHRKLTLGWSTPIHRRFDSLRTEPAGQRRWTVLEMLVNGYWNYNDFLVVPPGWQVVVNAAEGMLSAEEISS